MVGLRVEIVAIPGLRSETLSSANQIKSKDKSNRRFFDSPFASLRVAQYDSSFLVKCNRTQLVSIGPGTNLLVADH
jgi:hypothetical protein